MSLNLNPLALVSGAVESVCDAVLPKQLEFVGDLASLATDVQSGNLLKGLDDLCDLTQDLPQQLADLASPPKRADAAETLNQDPRHESSEPTSPAPYTRLGFRSPVLSPDALAAPSLRGTASSGPSTPPATGGDPLSTAPSSATQVASTSDSPPEDGLTGGTTATKANSTKSEEAPGTAASATSIDSSSTSAPSPGLEQSTAATNAQATTASAPSNDTGSMPSTTASDRTVDAFFKLSDKDLMNAVRDGKIPDSVSKDPEQMRRLQMRMNDISEMNQLITTMLSTLHDMSKQIIQNLRV